MRRLLASTLRHSGCSLSESVASFVLDGYPACSARTHAAIGEIMENNEFHAKMCDYASSPGISPPLVNLA